MESIRRKTVKEEIGKGKKLIENCQNLITFFFIIIMSWKNGECRIYSRI